MISTVGGGELVEAIKEENERFVWSCRRQKQFEVKNQRCEFFGNLILIFAVVQTNLTS